MPKCSQRACSVLTFFAQDSGTHNLVYASADNDVITVRLERRAYSPVLRKAGLPNATIPWLGNRTLRCEFI